MNKIKLFIIKHWFLILALLILAIATFLRFYNFENRWGLAYDQARDVIVAREALKMHKLPLIGPFASAGQFVYGPQWYWILMFMIEIFPNAVLTPWIIQTALYVAVVLLMIFIGKEIQGKFFGILVGLLIAVSPMQISYATNLISPSMVSIFSILSVYFFVKFIKKQKNLDGFLMALSIATAVNIHFQAIGLLVLIPISFIFGTHSIKKALILLIGAIIPFTPLIIFDFSTNFFESRNWLDYYLYGQYRMYVPNRWLTYLGVYWPDVWAKIVGGNKILGYGAIFFLSLFSFYLVFKKKITKSVLSIIISFLCMVTLLRYYRGERVDSYIVFLHPFVLILTSWVIYTFFKINRAIGLTLFLLLFFSSIQFSMIGIQNATNHSSAKAQHWKDILTHTYPGQKFAVYDYKYSGVSNSFSLVMFLEADGKLDDNGYKIGFGNPPGSYSIFHPEILGNKTGYVLKDLNSSSSTQLDKEQWAFINPSMIYHSTVEWYKK